ncbi:MAG: two-component system LytT family sensor kinase [Glaciecola sp.]|jgi:two-component system LytT family sensor kinase
MNESKNSSASQHTDSYKRAAQDVFSNKNKPSFWLLHVAGWLGYVVIFSFDNILFTHEKDVGFGVMIPLFISGTMAALLTLPLRYLYRQCWHLNPRNLILVIIIASFIVALIWTPAKNITMWNLNNDMEVWQWMKGSPEKNSSPWVILTSLSYAFFMIFVWSNLYFGINYHYRLMNEKQLHLEAARLSHFAQIKMLRYQINPHFLFNTLNAISTLVLQGNKEKANGMLVRLSTFLRFSLDNDPEKKIPLYDEIKASMLYLEIEKTRFDERLAIVMTVSPEAEPLLVPSLILQPLIENSVKYAIANMEAGGLIEIKAYCADQLLHLCVADNGPGIPEKLDQYLKTKPMNGVGLNNIKERLAVLYPENHHFETSKRLPQGYKVDIIIPMELP